MSEKIQGCKRAAITVEQFIAIVILVISLVVILLFWTLANPSGQVDKEACHSSVVLRASSTIGKFDDFKDAIPLQCSTEKICFKSGFFSNGCKDLGTTDIENIKIDSTQEIKDAITEKMYDWHSTLGEGKINFMPGKIKTKNYCIINAIISSDNKTKDIVNAQGITYGDIYRNLETKRTPKGTTYFQEMYGSTSYESWLANNPRLAKISKDKIDFNNQQVMVTMITEKGLYGTYLAGTGAGVAVGVAAIAAFSIVTGGTAVIGSTAILAILAASGSTAGIVIYSSKPNPSGDDSFNYAPPQIMAWDADSLRALDCDSFENSG